MSKTTTALNLCIRHVSSTCLAHICPGNQNQLTPIDPKTITSISHSNQVSVPVKCLCEFNVQALKEKLNQQCQKQACQAKVYQSADIEHILQTQFCSGCWIQDIASLMEQKQKFEQATAEKATLQANYQQLQQSHQILQQNLEQANTQCDELRAEKEQLMRINNQTQTNNQQMSEQILALRQQIQQSQEQNKENKLQIEKLNRSFKNLMADHSTRLEQQHQQLNQKHQLIQSLNESLDSSTNRLKELQKSNLRLIGDSENYTQSLRQIQQLKEEISTLKYDHQQKLREKMRQTMRLKGERDSLELVIKLQSQNKSSSRTGQSSSQYSSESFDQMHASHHSSDARFIIQQVYKKMSEKNHMISDPQEEMNQFKVMEESLKQHIKNVSQIQEKLALQKRSMEQTLSSLNTRNSSDGRLSSPNKYEHRESTRYGSSKSPRIQNKQNEQNEKIIRQPQSDQTSKVKADSSINNSIYFADQQFIDLPLSPRQKGDNLKPYTSNESQKEDQKGTGMIKKLEGAPQQDQYNQNNQIITVQDESLKSFKKDPYLDDNSHQGNMVGKGISVRTAIDKIKKQQESSIPKIGGSQMRKKGENNQQPPETQAKKEQTKMDKIKKQLMSSRLN